MTTQPAVSIILPTYNRMPYLREAVESVAGQTYRDWELLVLDDGSTDASPRYLESLEDSRIRVFQLRHSGNPARVRNVGIAEARGEYVAFLDSDDLWHTAKLERQIAAMRGRSNCSWSYTDVTVIDAASVELPRQDYTPFDPRAKSMLEAVLRNDTVFALPTLIVQRQLLLRLGGFDESLRFCEDFDLWIRLAEAGDGLVVRERLAGIRQHPSHSRTAGWFELDAHFVRVYERYRSRASDARLRRICQDRKAYHRVHLANRLLYAGQRRKATQQLRKAVRERPRLPWLWRTWIKAMLPAPILRRVAAIRASS